MEADWYPAFPLALAAAALFGVSVVVARMGLAHVHARTGAWISIASTTAFYLLIYPFYPAEAAWDRELLLVFAGLFLLLGMFTPGTSLFLAFEGHRRLGPTISGTVASSSPLFAAVTAVLVLGETINARLAVGTVAVVAGVMLLSWQGKAQRDWRYWALLFPLSAAFLRGVTSMGARYGMGIAPAPLTAALFAAMAAVVTLPVLCRATRLPLPRDGLRKGVKWFLLSGVLNALATISMYTALLHGEVVTVAPVVATFPVFTFIASLAMGMDRLRLRIVLGVVLVVAGVIAVKLAW